MLVRLLTKYKLVYVSMSYFHVLTIRVMSHMLLIRRINNINNSYRNIFPSIKQITILVKIVLTHCH